MSSSIFKLAKALCVVYSISLSCNAVLAKDSCYSRTSEALACFFAHDDGTYKHQLVEENSDDPNITIQTYLLYSQRWPIGNYPDMPSTVWQHRLILYIPQQISHTQALLYVTGGYNTALFKRLMTQVLLN